MRTFAGLGLVTGALVFTACPPREVAIEITPVGAQTMIGTCGTGLAVLADATRQCNDIVAACRMISDDCVREGCDALQLVCNDVVAAALEGDQCSNFDMFCDRALTECPMDIADDLQCDEVVAACESIEDVVSSVCIVPELHRPDFSGGRAPIAVRVALVTEVGGALMAASGCGRGVIQCEGDVTSNCVADALNDAIAQAIGKDGLGFDGLEEADQTLPLLLVFDDSDGNGCAPNEMFGCAALGRLAPASETYDAVCGWCQEGIKPNLPTAPCEDICQLGFCVDIAAESAE